VTPELGFDYDCTFLLFGMSGVVFCSCYLWPVRVKCDDILPHTHCKYIHLLTA